MKASPTLNTITLYMGAHGSEPNTHPGRVGTRSSDPRVPPPDFKVNLLSFAGLANIETEVGILYYKEKINKIKQSGYDKKYNLFTDKVVNQLIGLGMDRVTLSYLVPRIFKDKTITSQAESISVIDDMKNEMLALGILADVIYSKTSPPERIENPTFEKMWWFDYNPGEDKRRSTSGTGRARLNTSSDRTMPARAAGDIGNNPIMSTNGLFILHTTNKEHDPFSISSIDEIEYDKKGLHIIRSDAIMRRNLLRKINYTSYWKRWIEAFDFTDVPDDVLKIDSIREALFIVKQIYSAFHSENATDNPDEIEEEKENKGEPKPVAEGPQPPPSLSKKIKNILKTIISSRAKNVTQLNNLIEDANVVVQTQQDIFRTAADDADKLEEKIKEQRQQRQSRSKTLNINEMEQQLAAADIGLDTMRTSLTEAKNHAGKLESQLHKLEGEIVAGVTKFISCLISQSYDPHVKNAIKNMIMRNKLKNILKFGIIHKRLSLSQIILFFHSLGYHIINIIDPTCFSLKPPRIFETDMLTPLTEDMIDSHTVMIRLPPTWTDELPALASLLETGTNYSNKMMKRKRTMSSSNSRKSRRNIGGTKRKKSYSQKHRKHY